MHIYPYYQRAYELDDMTLYTVEYGRTGLVLGLCIEPVHRADSAPGAC